MEQDIFTLAGKAYHSRLLVGTGRYNSPTLMREAVKASGAEIVTVSLRRVKGSGELSPLEVLGHARYTFLPNTAGCFTAEDAIRTLRLAREAGGFTLVKLEVIGDRQTLFPDVEETIKACRLLSKEGFEVMAYTSDDPVAARKLEDAGAVAIMPLAAPIGSGLGIQNPLAIERIIQQTRLPVLVDAGIGTASDAAIAMELGCAGVLLNTAIAEAKNPVLMASAMRQGVLAGRAAYRAGRMPKRHSAKASSPTEGIIAAVGKKA